MTSAFEAMREDGGNLDEAQKQLNQTFALEADALIAKRISPSGRRDESSAIAGQLS